jgi:hypothetical protein
MSGICFNRQLRGRGAPLQFRDVDHDSAARKSTIAKQAFLLVAIGQQ